MGTTTSVVLYCVYAGMCDLDCLFLRELIHFSQCPHAIVHVSSVWSIIAIAVPHQHMNDVWALERSRKPVVHVHRAQQYNWTAPSSQYIKL